MKTILLIFASLSVFAQPKIVIEVTNADGSISQAKITGAPAAAGLESLNAWLATQKNDNGTAKYANAAELTKHHLIALLEQLVAAFPSSATAADVAEIKAKEAALAAKRKALFDAARAER